MKAKSKLAIGDTCIVTSRIIHSSRETLDIENGTPVVLRDLGKDGEWWCVLYSKSMVNDEDESLLMDECDWIPEKCLKKVTGSKLAAAIVAYELKK